MNVSWKNEAVRRFPEFADRFEKWKNPYLLWFDLRDAFEEAYGRLPLDDDLIGRIYGFAEWFSKQPSGMTAEDDLPTCVAVCFYEHVPESPAALKDMPRWLPRSAVLEMREVLSYHAGEEGFRNVLEAFDEYREKVVKKFSRKGKRKRR
jgi:hypothetical protein